MNADEALKALEEVGNMTACVAIKYHDEDGKRRTDNKTVQVREYKGFDTVRSFILEAARFRKAESMKNVIVRRHETLVFDKVVFTDDLQGNCPSCEWTIDRTSTTGYTTCYCPNCGQAIKWNSDLLNGGTK